MKARELISVSAWRFAALLFLAAAILGAARYPVANAWLGAGMVVYALALWRFPVAWLLMLPALMPVLDLTPWSGWFYFEEIDLFVLVTLALGYWRAPRVRPELGFSAIAWGLLGLLTCSYGVSAAIGLTPWSPLDANAFSNYLSHYNALRIAKGFGWALLLLPLLRRARAQDDTAFSRWLVAGMVVGLAGVTLAAWWERWTFVGLMDFATDYRITAMFSGMHVGGAALDGFLALSVPFGLAWLLARRGHFGVLLGLLLFAAASYAVLASFSRGLYLAYALIVLLGLIAVWREGGQKPSRTGWLLGVAMLSALGVILWGVFGAGGYRALAAFVVLFAALGLLMPRLHAWQSWAGALVLVPVVAGVSWAVAMFSDKAAYIAFAVSFGVLVLAADLASAQSRSVRETGRVLAAACLIWLGGNAVWIARYWGGDAALRPAALAAGLAVVMVVSTLIARRAWRLDRRNLSFMGVALLALALAVPALHSYRMQDRFGEAKGDFSGRMAHWRIGAGLVDGGAQWFGVGLGRFAETYFWKNPLGEFPGTYRIVSGGDRNILELGGARGPEAYGEPLRIGQRIGLAQCGARYTLHVEARTRSAKAKLVASVCEKWLLYGGACVGKEIILNASTDKWQSIDVALAGDPFSNAPWYARPTLQFSLVNDSPGTVIEVSRVSLRDASGEEHLRNGNLSAGFDGWYFSSDHYHLPWHAKNLWLNVYVDQGLFGLSVFSLVLTYVLVKLARGAPASGTPRFALAAAVSGFLVVGLFDSLLDVPRLAWLFYLLVFVAMLQPNGAINARRARRRPGVRARIPAQDTATPPRSGIPRP